MKQSISGTLQAGTGIARISPCGGKEPPLFRPEQGNVAVDEPGEGDLAGLAPFEDRALEVRREERKAEHAPGADHVGRGIEGHPAGWVLLESGMGLPECADQDGIAGSAVFCALDDLAATVPGREPERDDQGLEAVVRPAMWIGMQRDGQTAGLDGDAPDQVER